MASTDWTFVVLLVVALLGLGVDVCGIVRDLRAYRKRRTH
jgi:hypothetical protein